MPPVRVGVNRLNLQAVRARYTAPCADPLAREVARRQRDRLSRCTIPSHLASSSPSRWGHVPLAGLFAAAGNSICAGSGGTVRTGHEPCHRSRSGLCLVIWVDEGRWWCSSCRRGGDAVAAVCSLEGVPYAASVARLIEAWGAPADYWRRRAHGARP